MNFSNKTVWEFIKKPAFSIFVLFLFHFSGAIGMQTSHKQWFIDLTPLNLAISFVMVFRHEKYKSMPLLIVSIALFALGYMVEVAGVNTGIIFGEYQYGPVLGYKLWNTPLMIGLNWLMLVFCIGVVVDTVHSSFWVKSMLGAAALTAYDFIIEPVAIANNFWTWKEMNVPMQNYVAWYVFSFLFLVLFYKSPVEKNNPVARWFLMIQVIFFLTLNLLL